MRRALAGLAILLALAAAGSAVAAPPSDSWLEGYATAVLERELRVSAASLRVRGGVLTLSAEDLGTADRERALALLHGVRGIVRVEITPGPATTRGAVAPAVMVSASAPAGPAPQTASAPPREVAHLDTG